MGKESIKTKGKFPLDEFQFVPSIDMIEFQTTEACSSLAYLG
jgi:hypothetical protein